ncbi:MAG TPA: hypothetical protein VLA71_11595, partial [Algoriphagus sp.]|nr:hypothetical protein [Algoriphagus sp.]
VPVSLIFFFIRSALFVFYQAQPDLLHAGTQGKKLFPYSILNQLPVGFKGTSMVSPVPWMLGGHFHPFSAVAF